MVSQYLRADSVSEVLGSFPSLATRVLRTHITSVEDSAGEFTRILGNVGAVFRLICNSSSISNNLLIYKGVVRYYIVLGEEHNLPPFAAASTTKRHMECTMTAVAQLSIPPLRGRK